MGVMDGSGTTMTSQRDLVEEARRGSREALDRLVESIEEPLRLAISRRMGPHLKGEVEPEDVFQDTWAHACQSLDRFRWEGEGSFLRWLGGIAEHVILAAVDKRRRRAILELRRPAMAPSEVSPSRGLRREERFERLEKALGSLSPDHRQVILLSRIEGLQIQEIAGRMGRSTSAVKNLLLRALKELKRSFGDTGSLRLPDRAIDPSRDFSANPSVEPRLEPSPHPTANPSLDPEGDHHGR
jgi:RNA polymerase sigma-70 factor (ECF subfamily)